jgi:hypothetical protein
MSGFSRTKPTLARSWRLYSPGDRNHHRRREWLTAFPRSRKKTLAAEIRIAEASAKTYCTAAITGIQMIIALRRCGWSSSSRSRGTSPHVKPTTPAVVVETGSTSFGKAICRISLSWRTTDVLASLMTAEYHFQGRIAAKMKRG